MKELQPCILKAVLSPAAPTNLLWTLYPLVLWVGWLMNSSLTEGVIQIQL